MLKIASIKLLKDGGRVELHIDTNDDQMCMERWYNSKGQIHRDNGLPSTITNLGYESYCVHGDLLLIRYEDGDVWESAWTRAKGSRDE